MSLLPKLHAITNRILDLPADAWGELFESCDDLYQFLVKLTAIDLHQAGNREPIQLDKGKVIDLISAAMCIKDIVRTKKFMQGLFEATQELVNKKKDGPVHIRYAGTGPFAALALPLTARFSASQVQFTLLEINERSFDCLQKLMGILQLEPYIRRLEKADATNWTPPAGESTDIFLSETMNLGLSKEPQAAIFMRMLPALEEQTIIIPSNIRLEAALIDPAKRISYKMGNRSTDDSCYPLATVFELNREAVLANAAPFAKTNGTYSFPDVVVDVPAKQAGKELCILTSVTIFRNIQIGLDESPLTLPLPLFAVAENQGFRLRLFYQISKQPGVQWVVE